MYKVNNINYVKDNNILVTLEKFLTYNQVTGNTKEGTFTDIFKDTVKKEDSKEDKENNTVDNIFRYIFEDAKNRNKKTVIIKEKDTIKEIIGDTIDDDDTIDDTDDDESDELLKGLFLDM
jgi:hypothetical protein